MKYKLMLLMELILGIPKSIYINFRYLPFKQAIRFPILVSYWCKPMTLHGKVRIEAPIKTGMIMLGVGAYGLIDHRYCRSLFTNSSGGVLHLRDLPVLDLDLDSQIMENSKLGIISI